LDRTGLAGLVSAERLILNDLSIRASGHTQVRSKFDRKGSGERNVGFPMFP